MESPSKVTLVLTCMIMGPQRPAEINFTIWVKGLHTHLTRLSCHAAFSSMQTGAISLKEGLVYERNANGIYFNSIQRVSGEDEANPSKPPREEVLQGADWLLLL